MEELLTYIDERLKELEEEKEELREYQVRMHFALCVSHRSTYARTKAHAARSLTRNSTQIVLVLCVCNRYLCARATRRATPSHMQQHTNRTRANFLIITQVLDKDRRSLEFTIYDAELKSAVDKLQELEKRRTDEAAAVDALHNEAAELREQLKQAEKELKYVTNDLLQFQKEKDRLDEERSDFLKEKASLQLNVDDAKARIADKHKQQVHARAHSLYSHRGNNTNTHVHILTPLDLHTYRRKWKPIWRA